MTVTLEKKRAERAELQPSQAVVSQSGRELFIDRLLSAEAGYLKAVPEDKRPGLKARYNDSRSQLDEGVLSSFVRTADQYGIQFGKVPPALQGQNFTDCINEVRICINQAVRDLFPEDRSSTFQQTKEELVLRQSGRYLDLLEKAIKRGELPGDIKASDVFKLMQLNVLALRLQETAAMEVSLGDHGVRHLIDHNIDVCEKIADKVTGFGVKGINFSRRLMMHQIMIFHDLGYAMDSVREPMRTEGIKGQDFGHNLLAAQCLRQLFSQNGSPLAAIFGPGNSANMHHAILYHDRSESGKPDIQFSNDRSIRQNLTSIVQLADNTAAFSSKLAAVLYEIPKSLVYMRLMKSAAEIGDDAAIKSLKEGLAAAIERNEVIPPEEKVALKYSVSQLSAQDYKFSVGRMGGTEPEFTGRLNSDGSVGIHISVKESSLHQEILSTFAISEYKQLVKFIKDLTDQNVDINRDSGLTFVETPGLTLEVRTGVNKDDTPDTRFEQAVNKLLQLRPFREYMSLDKTLADLSGSGAGDVKKEDMERIVLLRKSLLAEYTPKIIAAIPGLDRA